MANELIDEKAVFNSARCMSSPEERMAYLQKACGEDSDALRRLRDLLRVYDQENSFLESPALVLGATVDEPVTEKTGTVIGPYKLLEQIGEGGFGTVFMAEQQEPVRRKVALKVLKPGMDSRQVVARFEAERQALALMDHPHIAHVFDGGETPTGRPYFVMELVRGVPITDFCDQDRLGVRERLGLFAGVCDAVQHAHQKGVIHRDLKPSNVLVTRHDDKAVPKVIDFGIAKATGQQLTDKTLFTNFAQMIGTPLYMSPEQAQLSGLDVDTRSDVYSLGVLLYELLTGATPFDTERFKAAGYDEMRRIIREEEPPRPSTRLSTAGKAATTASANRGSDPRRLSRLFRGELDWVAMKALEKDRGRRYESASAFAADVRRYLADEPVQACPPSAVYRLRKFARRRRVGLAIAGLILFFIAVVGGGGGWVLRDRAAREEAAAKERRERVQRLTARVEQMLEDLDRLERGQKWPEAQAAAGRAEAALAGGEADDAVRRRVADARRELAFVAELDRIRQERAATGQGRRLNNAGAARDYAVAFRDYGVDVQALPAEEVVARLRGNAALAAPLGAALDDWVDARRCLGNDPSSWKPLVAVARGLDPDPLRDRLRAAWGEPRTPALQAELRQLAESIDVKSQSPATLIALAYTLEWAQLADSALRTWQDGQYAYPGDFFLNLQFGNLLNERKDHAGALRYYSVAVSLRPDSSVAHNNLGLALDNQAKLDEAVAEYHKAIERDPKYAPAHSNLGDALRDQGKLDEAVAECRTAIDYDPKLAPAHNNLGNALRDQGKLDEAVAEYRQAVALDPNDARVLNNFGYALHAQGKSDEALAEYRKAIALDPKVAKAHNNLGNALRDQGKLDEAVAEYRKAIAVDEKYALAHYNLGLALYDQGKLDDAVAEDRKAIALDPKDAPAHYNLGLALLAQGKLDEAVAACRKAIELDPKSAKAHYNLGLALYDQGKLDEAIAEYRQAIALQPDDAEAHCNLGHALRRQGLFREALEELRRGHELGSKRPGWRYPSAEWVGQCERLVELDEKLPAFLDGKTAPAGAGERIELAGLCALKRLNRAAAGFYEDAFAAEPKLADDLAAGHRYNAACAAALAAVGQGKDVDRIGDKEKSRLRAQALDWLRADLEALGRLLDTEATPAPTAAGVASTLKHWQSDPDLAGVRGAAALARLPEAERQPWQKLWDDAADLLARAQAKQTPVKKSDAK
jgi:serine/threonine protein kinase/Tfp pilus assembly protein PilF